MISKWNLRALAAAVVLSAGFSSQASAEVAAGVLARGQTLSVGIPRGKGDPVVYDATGAEFTTTTGSPRTFIGGAANIDGPGPQVDVTSMDLFMAATAAGSYTNIRARVQFWDTYVQASSPVFSNAAGTVIEADFGPLEAVANTVYTLTINLPAPLRLNSLNAKGFTVSFQGDTGAGLATADALTTALSINGAQNVGTSAVNSGNGFYRNVGNQTTFNFQSTDLRTFTGITDARASIVLRGNATVPVSLQAFDVE
ncbi:hypothetical protein [Tahibacter soli]|jgi:hypothetical protein|uniref:Uncharacterized protein n=1 Tax=Tahibacter soli TaxID=2983605 RepID=A0A9X3YP20_9GAMM|nr:hypothetical protein [Tahibacter soli]MDC8014313.1 hypothetical protein [Tahibacter soli]